MEMAEVDINEVKYWVAFRRVPSIGRVRYALLENHFGSLEAAWQAGAPELQEAGLDRRSVQAITTRRPAIDPDTEMEKLERQGVRVFTWKDQAYPPRLKEIYDLPPVLFVKGTILPEDERSVAVVGTRKATAYGKEAAHRLTWDLARNGVTVVSGLARGIDGIAHRAALEAGGRTIGVLACGLDIVYPAEHYNMAQQIIGQGALVSEHPLGAKPAAENFPRRNRIMSGMTLGTLVVEAGEASGALWTVRHALEQDREVFAVPGSIFSPASRATNQLIQQGAKPVMDFKDILEELNLSAVSQQMEMKALFPSDDTESQVLRYITYEPSHIDEVIRGSGLPISQVSSSLAMMEIKGLVKQVGGLNYVRVKETVAEYETAV